MAPGLPDWAVEILMSTIGGGLALLLLVLFSNKQPREPGDVPAAGALSALLAWYAFQTVSELRNRLLDVEPSTTLDVQISTACQMLTLAFLLHAALRWRRISRAWGFPIYAFFAASLFGLGGVSVEVYFAVMFPAIIVVSLANATTGTALHGRRFHWGVAFLFPTIAVVTWLDLQSVAELLSVAAMATVLWLVHSRQLLGLRVERRLVTVMGLATMSVVYLITVDAAANRVSEEGVGLEEPIKFVLLCAAGLLWLPLYAGIARLFTRRTESYMRMVRRALASADRLLDLDERCEHLCRTISEQFGFRRCCLILRSPRGLRTGYARTGTFESPSLEPYLSVARERRLELLEDRQASVPYVHKALRDSGWQCAVPLWLKGDVIGFLFIDAGLTPSLEDLRTIFPNLGREMAQSISVCTLIEEKVRLERTLMRREHLAGLGQLAATVAHEVKNPLSSIRAIAQIMSEDPAVQENHERDIEFISSETARLASTVQQLLAYARPSANRVVAEAPVFEVIDTIANAMQREQAARGIDIQAFVDEQLRRWKAPGEPLREVVINLMLNAVEFSKAGMAVELSASLSGDGRCRIEVTDSGPGVPEDAREKIFEPFFTTREKGTGLGLATVKKNVTEMGGTVEVLSPVSNGRGSCFRVLLPVMALEVEG